MATIFGTNGNDANLFGTNRADAIHGLWGDDRILGFRGRDFLYGDNGNDTLDGGGGPDVIDGGGQFDVVLYSSNTTPVRADLRTGVVSFPEQRWPDETLVNVKALDGGTSRDTFIGNGAANLFTGKAGNDTLTGNIGSDTLLGGTGFDSLDGGNGPDSLSGGFGDDTMRGGLHDDIFTVGPSSDYADTGEPVSVDWGQDVYDGGAGRDTLYVIDPPVEYPSDGPVPEELAATTAVINSASRTLSIGLGTTGTLTSIEDVETDSGDDAITGNSAANFLSAGDGANVVYGGAGDDTIVGGVYTYEGDGSERLSGGTGNDVIYGKGAYVLQFYGAGYAQEPGRDILSGGNGNDSLHGEAPWQAMTGGNGADHFVLTDEIWVWSERSYVETGRSSASITDFDPTATSSNSLSPTRPRQSRSSARSTATMTSAPTNLGTSGKTTQPSSTLSWMRRAATVPC